MLLLSFWKILERFLRKTVNHTSIWLFNQSISRFRAAICDFAASLIISLCSCLDSSSIFNTIFCGSRCGDLISRLLSLKGNLINFFELLVFFLRAYSPLLVTHFADLLNKYTFEEFFDRSKTEESLELLALLTRNLTQFFFFWQSVI